MGTHTSTTSNSSKDDNGELLQESATKRLRSCEHRDTDVDAKAVPIVYQHKQNTYQVTDRTPTSLEHDRPLDLSAGNDPIRSTELSWGRRVQLIAAIDKMLHPTMGITIAEFLTRLSCFPKYNSENEHITNMLDLVYIYINNITKKKGCENDSGQGRLMTHLAALECTCGGKLVTQRMKFMMLVGASVMARETRLFAFVIRSCESEDIPMLMYGGMLEARNSRSNGLCSYLLKNKGCLPGNVKTPTDFVDLMSGWMSWEYFKDHTCHMIGRELTHDIMCFTFVVHTTIPRGVDDHDICQPIQKRSVHISICRTTLIKDFLCMVIELVGGFENFSRWKIANELCDYFYIHINDKVNSRVYGYTSFFVNGGTFHLTYHEGDIPLPESASASLCSFDTAIDHNMSLST
jgi:hypothetical protein